MAKRKHLWVGIESHLHRLEDEDAANTETTVDVEVAVAQSQDEQAQVDASIHEVEEAVDESDTGADNAEQVEMAIRTIKTYGLSRGLLAFINYNNGLALASGRRLPAVESIDATGASHAEAQACLEALSDTLRSWYDAIIKFLKSIWAKIQEMFRWVMSKIVSYKGTIGTLKGKLDSIQSIDEEKMKDKKANSMSRQKFLELSGALISLFDEYNSVITQANNKNSANLDTADGRESAMKEIEKGITKELNYLGFETKDNGDIKGNAKDAPEMKTEKLSDFGWTKETVLAAHDNVSKMVAKLEAFPKVQSVLKTVIDAAEKEAKALVATGAVKDDEARKEKGKVEFMRQAVSFGTRLATKMTQRSGEAARAWINAATAVIATAKAA